MAFSTGSATFWRKMANAMPGRFARMNRATRPVKSSYSGPDRYRMQPYPPEWKPVDQVSESRKLPRKYSWVRTLVEWGGAAAAATRHDNRTLKMMHSRPASGLAVHLLAARIGLFSTLLWTS